MQHEDTGSSASTAAEDSPQSTHATGGRCPNL